MIDGNQLDKHIQQTLSKVQGLLGVCSIREEDRDEILSLEDEVEKRSLMGMGKVVNSGVRKALQFDSLFVALTSKKFNWGLCSTLILKKGDQLVGEDIYDEEAIAKLSTAPNTWFLHKNFVIYKDLISFPKDIMQKICHFEIPGTTVDWLPDDTKNSVHFEVWYGYPSTFCDVYLKETYFDDVIKDDSFVDSMETGLGSIVIGVNSITDTGKEKSE